MPVGCGWTGAKRTGSDCIRRRDPRFGGTVGARVERVVAGATGDGAVGVVVVATGVWVCVCV